MYVKAVIDKSISTNLPLHRASDKSDTTHSRPPGTSFLAPRATGFGGRCSRAASSAGARPTWSRAARAHLRTVIHIGSDLVSFWPFSPRTECLVSFFLYTMPRWTRRERRTNRDEGFANFLTEWLEDRRRKQAVV